MKIHQNPASDASQAPQIPMKGRRSPYKASWTSQFSAVFWRSFISIIKDPRVTIVKGISALVTVTQTSMICLSRFEHYFFFVPVLWVSGDADLPGTGPDRRRERLHPKYPRCSIPFHHQLHVRKRVWSREREAFLFLFLCEIHQL